VKNLAETISKITKEDENLIFKPVKDIQKCIQEGGLITKKIKGELAGFVLITKLNSILIEIGSLYVYPKFRNNGLAKELLTEAITTTENKRTFIRTKSKPLIAFMENNNFQKISLRLKPRLALRIFISRCSSFSRAKNFIKSINKKSCSLLK
jgi:ribosomal protein S18 acetylase RimI-like enzyme